MSYPGGKGAVYQWLINQIPPHDVFISTHLGQCAIMRYKRPARINIGIDLDETVIDDWRHEIGPGLPVDHTARSGGTGGRLADWAAARQGQLPGSEITGASGARYRFLCCDSVKWLQTVDWKGGEFVYSDPPYLLYTRKQQAPIYAHEYSEADHRALLAVLVGLPCKVMISGYQSDLYDKLLPGWRKDSTRTITRGGTPAIEFVWMNYDPPDQLHDYRYLGDDYRQRERIRKRKRRWAAGWARMERLERLAVLAAIQESGLGG
jgi:hypothetical protein